MAQPQTKFQANVTDEQTSALRKYQDTVLGRRGTGYLLKFELILLCCSWVPGALGFFLRKICYPALFAEVGRGTVFGRNVVLRHPHKIKIGRNVMIDDDCVLDAKGCQEADLVIGDNVILSRGCVLSAKAGRLSLGANTNVGANCLLYAVKQLTIGSNTLLAAQCYVGGSMYHIERTDIAPIEQGSYANGVTIGDGCWLGAGVKVMDGVSVGDGVVLGTGAVVNRDLAPFTVAVGVPARVMKQR